MWSFIMRWNLIKGFIYLYEQLVTIWLLDCTKILSLVRSHNNRSRPVLLSWIPQESIQEVYNKFGKALQIPGSEMLKKHPLWAQTLWRLHPSKQNNWTKIIGRKVAKGPVVRLWQLSSFFGWSGRNCPDIISSACQIRSVWEVLGHVWSFL